MNVRERFLAVMQGEPVDRGLLWENGYWAGTVRRWYKEGLPRKVGVPDWAEDGTSIIGGPSRIDARSMRDPKHGLRDGDVRDFFGLDEGFACVPLKSYLVPEFEEVVLEDHGAWVLRRTTSGMLERNWKNRDGFPHWVQGPVASREDWEQIKAERLQPTLEGRLPDDWPAWVAEFRERTYPLMIGGGPSGCYGVLRNLLGQEQVLMAFYDQPELVRDIIDYMLEYWITLYDQVLDQVDVDMAYIWEDMCYKNGPLISPAMFRELMLPAYKRLTGFLHDRGVPVITVDTDGNCWKLLPLFIEGGVTALLPFEAQAGMDVVEVRKAFPRLGILGGMNKSKMAIGREAIDEEVEGKIPFMLERGAFVPSGDHQVPPDVSWENFKYYREKLNALILGK